MDILVKTLSGLENTLADELQRLGADQVDPILRAVKCRGDLRLLYRINLEARTALRVLTPVHRFKARNEDQLYRGVRELDWSDYLSLSGSLAVDSVVHSDQFTHSHYVALKTKDAVVDQFRDRTGRRPNVDTDNPDLRINVHINQDLVSLSLDSSGDSLHRRGYRQLGVEAPINEVLAAGMILISGWQPDETFVDPMCGSGTLPIEAARIARRIPPQWQREHFGFTRWKNFDKTLWKAVRDKAEAAILSESPASIYAYDVDMRAIRATRRNADRAGVAEDIHIQRRPFERLEPPAPTGTLIMNPPYDERLSLPDIEAFYQMIGDRLKQEFAGYRAWIISSHLPAIKHIGLQSSSRRDLYNGALACKFLEYDLYQGSRKAKNG